MDVQSDSIESLRAQLAERDENIERLQRERDEARAALGFYARREHMTGEPWSEWEWAEADSSNWLTPPTDEGMAVENGGIARAALGGEGLWN